MAIQILIGTVTLAGALYFGPRAGGGWIVSAALLAAAWPLWIFGAPDSSADRRGRRLAAVAGAGIRLRQAGSRRLALALAASTWR